MNLFEVIPVIMIRLNHNHFYMSGFWILIGQKISCNSSFNRNANYIKALIALGFYSNSLFTETSKSKTTPIRLIGASFCAIFKP